MIFLRATQLEDEFGVDLRRWCPRVGHVLGVSRADGRRYRLVATDRVFAEGVMYLLEEVRT